MNYTTEEEIWKDVEGYEGYYQVSNFGRVKSLERTIPHSRFGTQKLKEKILTEQINKGYVHVTLSKDGGQKKPPVSRMVAKAFIPNPDNKPEVNHIDENKLNNRVSNLEWVTAKENANHGTRPERLRKSSIKLNTQKYLHDNPDPLKSRKMKRVYEQNKVPVKQLALKTDTIINIFPSIADANEYLGKKKDSTGILDCLSGRSKTAYGFKWERIKK